MKRSRKEVYFAYVRTLAYACIGEREREREEDEGGSDKENNVSFSQKCVLGALR